MWLDLIIAMSCGGAGLACGWVMHATNTGLAALTDGDSNVVPVVTNEAIEVVEQTPERISEVAEKLRAYARTMAADVDAHQTTVQAVNNQLNADQSGSPEAVFQAITQLIEANELMQSQLHVAQDRIHDQALQIESAERRAETDALTRVPNRGAFDKHLARQHALGAGKAGTLALLDVDHFKKFNDVYGHRAGDEVLRVVASILHSRLDKYGIVARFGGEEFAVILDGCRVDQAKDLVDAARAAIGAREIVFEDKRLCVNASAGVAELQTGEAPENWLQRADDGLYRSKEAGRNCSHWMDGTTPIKVAASEAIAATQAKAAANSSSTSPTGEQESATDKKSVSEAVAEAKPKQKMFANLPDRADLGETFDEVRGRTQSTVSMFVMAIRCNGESSTTGMRSLMQIVRATLRSVDRLGCDDDSTFLVFMPSVDEATAQNRSLQICRSATAIGMGKSELPINPISIGVSQVRAGDDFDGVVNRSIEFAEKAKVDSSEPVLIAPGE
ncbi:GGDEF domain-containing protein [Rubripirellula reticaptiva]|uniref:diguanylate cyclase n=1 Tax=Rubripirellula reticaptiva TaxID=2528013 RepID=A0A5C6FDF9_9BACT|nr:GGDEF domain-containing protein [Rubripirellula reticaptiva]TWU58106.1 putative diguanylate cyclase YdaM [Rubripirellula reticaptiva]